MEYLHDEEVRVVDVELHGMEEVLHARGLRRHTVDHVLVAPADDDLHQPKPPRRPLQHNT
jgi:hypothetical protein